MRSWSCGRERVSYLYHLERAPVPIGKAQRSPNLPPNPRGRVGRFASRRAQLRQCGQDVSRSDGHWTPFQRERQRQSTPSSASSSPSSDPVKPVAPVGARGDLGETVARDGSTAGNRSFPLRARLPAATLLRPSSEPRRRQPSLLPKPAALRLPPRPRPLPLPRHCPSNLAAWLPTAYRLQCSPAPRPPPPCANRLSRLARSQLIREPCIRQHRF